MFDPALIRVLAVPAIAVLFKILPIRMPSTGLMKAAFGLWLMGGLSLIFSGYGRLSAAGALEFSPMLVGGLAVAIGIGLIKGRFVLSKTSSKNIERLQQFTDMRPLFDTYGIRSWIMIGIMLCISASLTWLNTPLFIRGLVNIGIGMALTVSSFRYVAALANQSANTDANPSPSN